MSALCKICGHHGLLPRPLAISLHYNQLNDPLYRVGYADVLKGEHKGCQVALRVWVVSSASDFSMVTSVGPQRLLLVSHKTADSSHPRNSARRL